MKRQPCLIRMISMLLLIFFIACPLDGGEREWRNSVNIENTGIEKLNAAGVDYACELVVISDSRIAPEDFMQISAKITNIGSVMAGTLSKIQYFLSDDPSYSADDWIIGYDIISQLKAGYYEQCTRFFQVPANLALGNYYVGVLVDADDDLTEGDETNNAFVSDDPMLLVQNQRVQWTRVFLDDFESDFGWPNWNSSTSTGDYGWERTPYNPYSGSYSLWCAAKALNGKTKLDPSVNNTLTPFKTIASTLEKVDLSYCEEVCVSFDYRGNDYIDTNPNFTMSWGMEPATGTTVRFDAGSKPGWQQIQKYGSSEDTPLVLPANYSRYFNLQYWATITQSHNGVFLDNFQICKFLPYPEFTCPSLVLGKTEAAWGDTIPVSFTLLNEGERRVSEVPFQFYLSADQTASPDDILLTTTESYKWFGLEALQDEFMFAVPHDIAPGTYYFYVNIDPTDIYEELVSEDNAYFSATPLTIHDRMTEWQSVFVETFDAGFPEPNWELSNLFGTLEWTVDTSDVRRFEGFTNLHCQAPYSSTFDYESWITLKEPLDLSDCLDAVLEFYLWYYFDDFDYLDICVRPQGGAWTLVRINGHNWGWQKYSLPLSNFNGSNFVGQEAVEIAFKFRGEDIDHPGPYYPFYFGIYLDLIQVKKQVDAATTQEVTIQTSPVNAGFSVDGVSYSGSQPFTWDTGSSHTVEADAVVDVDATHQFVFGSWSDGGARSHQVTATTGSAVLSAYYLPQYLLQTSVQNETGGTVSPGSSQWYDAGETVTVTATPDGGSGYVFKEWTGDASGSENPLSVVMDTPKAITAVFELASAIQSAEIPDAFGVKQNIPNPFNPETRIAYEIPKAGEVTIEVFDLTGRKVRTLVHASEQPGSYQIVWDGRNDAGRTVSSGTYIYVMRCGTYQKRMKAVFLK